MLKSKNITVADIVNEKPQSAAVFKKYNIDFCCKGKRSMSEACTKAGVPEETIYQEIQMLSREGASNFRIHAWSNSLICEYIISNHHQYVRSVSPQILALSHKVASVHGGNHPELVQVYHKFSLLSQEMMEHLKKEEEKLFPAIKDGSVNSQLIHEIESEHDQAGQLMADIHQLTSGFQPPVDACTSYRSLFTLLEEFEDDLHQHVHVENNILIPRISAK